MTVPRLRTTPILGALASFLTTEASGGVILLMAAAAALIWANSPAASTYEVLWQTVLTIDVGGTALISMDLRHWINDALMALFFFVVGLEIKRELVSGELAEPRKATVPVVAAFGGMALPALIYVALNAGTEGVRGWGVPMATDIAFAIGVLALFGSRVPHGLKILLLSVAIVDDIGAILVIAVFYSGEVQLLSVAVAVALLIATIALWRVPRLWAAPPLALLMVAVWLATLSSGVHATIAGVALGLVVPASAGSPSPAVRLEKAFHPWTSYVIVPIFALANSGVRVDAGVLGEALGSSVAIGIAAGLVVGKVVGVTLATYLAVRTGLGRLPRGVTWPAVVAVAAVAGIGFTVSLFIAGLAFDGQLLSESKLGILGGSVVAAIIGSVLLWRTLPPARTGAVAPDTVEST
ncbi:MAG TPA: Na+/H+ antiporter NhaA [Candidatus Limnocylindria bacterium]|nr:Na+/H+ antiporter NhaA [Candidatus Limnocylindria bacterium]